MKIGVNTFPILNILFLIVTYVTFHINNSINNIQNMKIVTITLEINDSILDVDELASIIGYLKGCEILGYTELSPKDQ